MGKAIVGTNANASEPSQALATIIRAAQYVRMSRDHQKYSIANQSAANHVYAAQHGMEIIHTYSDEGRSGLSLNRRNALRQLITDVQTGKGDFEAIIVYDVSRWGRFQDADESAHYEFVCKRAGINVHYCAEQFQNDGSSFSAIAKAVKRAMAGEYSRELFALLNKVIDSAVTRDTVCGGCSLVRTASQKVYLPVVSRSV